jgi:hypothetical protein
MIRDIALPAGQAHKDRARIRIGGGFEPIVRDGLHFVTITIGLSFVKSKYLCCVGSVFCRKGYSPMETEKARWACRRSISLAILSATHA